MKHNFWGTALIAVGLLLLLGAAGLAAYNLQEDQNAKTSADSVLQELTAELPTQGTLPTQPDAGEETTPPVPPELQIPNYLLNPNMDLPVRVIEEREYVGILTIPDLALELPVLKEWSEKGAKVAPCRDGGTPYLDDLVICAHNYKAHFGRLNTLKTGALVTFTDMDGNVFTYEVCAFEELQPNQVIPLRQSEWDLTLYTCTIGGRTRFVVRCEKLMADR
jgi:sortase A